MVGAFCVGGGYASIPLIQTQVIDVHHWISFSEFMDVVAISQMTPGPIGINAATFVGTKVAGIGGAVAATAGFVTPSLIIMIALAKLLAKYGDMGAIRGVLNGLRPAARVPSIKRGFGLDTITPSVEVDLGLLCRHGKEDDARIESKRTLRRDRLVSTKSGLCKKAVDSFRQKPKNCLLIQSHRGKLSTNFRQGQHQTEQN